jgi:hypothetical protein
MLANKTRLLSLFIGHQCLENEVFLNPRFFFFPTLEQRKDTRLKIPMERPGASFSASGSTAYALPLAIQHGQIIAVFWWIFQIFPAPRRRQ